MKLNLNLIKRILNEELDSFIKRRNYLIKESSSRPTSGPGIVLTRYGGLSPVYTEGAPESRGLYAFIHGKLEPHLVGSTDSHGITSGTGRPSRLHMAIANRRPKGDREPSLGLRYFRYDGPIYSHFNIHHDSKNENGWYLTTARELREYVFGKQFVEEFKASAKKYNDSVRQNGYSHKQYLPKDMPKMSKDIFEVFIPARGGKILPYENDPRKIQNDSDEFPDIGRSSMKAKLARAQATQDRVEDEKFHKSNSIIRYPESISFEEKREKEKEEIFAIWERGRARGRYKEFENFEEFYNWMIEKNLDAKERKSAYQSDILRKKEKKMKKKIQA